MLKKDRIPSTVMHAWFKELWEERMDPITHMVTCFECGKKMTEATHKENTCCYSHILSKAKYPEQAMNPNNLEICHSWCHNLYTMKPKEAVNQYAKYLKLKEEL